MLNKKIMLNEYKPHPYRKILNDVGIMQFDLTNTLNVHQSNLSKQLRGILPMPETIESEIREILDKLQKPEPEPAKKIKRIPRKGK